MLNEHTLPGPGQAQLRSIASYVEKAATTHCSHTPVPKMTIWRKPKQIQSSKDKTAALISTRGHSKEFSYRKQNTKNLDISEEDYGDP